MERIRIIENDEETELWVQLLPQAPHTSSLLTLARKRCFATFAGVGGGVGATPPWRFQTKRRRGSRKKTADCARRVFAIGGIIFGPRSIFDPVMADQRSNFRKFRDFFVSRVHISKIWLILLIVAAWNLHQRVPHSILHRLWCFYASLLNIWGV